MPRDLSLSPPAALLSSDRIASSIPRTDSGATWQYPSPAMFHAAIQRKGSLPGHVTATLAQRPEEMEAIVHIHNVVNERAWQHILQFERLHEAEYAGKMPSLTRFVGRPTDLSPKARLLSFFGYVAPFDRHDWYVDRNGKTVRYVIDFYHGRGSALEASDKDGKLPLPPAVYLDVRPEASLEGIKDRLLLQWLRWKSA